MSLDTNMSYGGGGTSRRRPHVVWVLVAVPVLIVLFPAFRLVGAALDTPNSGPGAATPTPETPTLAPPPDVPATPATPAVRPEDAAPPAAWSTLMAFMGGWQSTSRATRADVFADTATAELTTELAKTETSKIVTQPVERVTITEAGDNLVVFEVEFVGGDVPAAAVQLLHDPESRSGWLASDVGTVR